MQTGTKFFYNGHKLQIVSFEYNEFISDFEVNTICISKELAGTEKTFTGRSFIELETAGEIKKTAK